MKRTLHPLASLGDPIQVEYALVNTGRELFAELVRIAVQVRLYHLKPIVHLEAHGDDSGLSLASGEHVDWDSLRLSLTDINIASGLHLTLLMAMCKGWHISKLLHPMHQAPAWAIIGPTVDVKAGVIAERTEAMYESLLLHGTGPSFVASLGSHNEDSAHRFFMQLAERMFCDAYAAYFKGYTTPEKLRQRENEIVATFVRNRGYSLDGVVEARLIARQQLRSDDDVFERCKEQFFMFDLFPRNRARFTIEAGDCGALSGTSQQASLLS